MNYFVEKKLLENGLKIVFVEISGFDNQVLSDEYQAYRDSKEKELVNNHRSIESDPILLGFHKLHENLSISKRKNIPASENLIRLLEKNQCLHPLNKVVDIYNLISIESGLCLGAHDLEYVVGNVTLRMLRGDETYIPLGMTEPCKVKTTEYAYCDDANDVLCRLEVRQVNKTKVTEDTTSAFFIIQGNMNTSDAYLNGVSKQLIDSITLYCGGEGKIIIPEVV